MSGCLRHGVVHDFVRDVSDGAGFVLGPLLERVDGFVGGASGAGDEDAAGLVDDAASREGFRELRDERNGSIVNFRVRQRGTGLASEARREAFTMFFEGLDVFAVQVERPDHGASTISGIESDQLMPNRSASAANRG